MRDVLKPECLSEQRQGVAIQLGEEEERRLERVEPCVAKRQKTGPARLGGQVGAVEARIVAHQNGGAGELGERREGRTEGRSSLQVHRFQVRESRDREGNRDAGVDERREGRAHVEVAPEPYRADIDDAVAFGVEPGGLYVDDDELGGAALMASG